MTVIPEYWTLTFALGQQATVQETIELLRCKRHPISNVHMAICDRFWLRLSSSIFTCICLTPLAFCGRALSVRYSFSCLSSLSAAVLWKAGGLRGLTHFISCSYIVRGWCHLFESKVSIKKNNMIRSKEINSYRVQSILSRCRFAFEEIFQAWRLSARWFAKSRLEGFSVAFFLLLMICLRYVNIWYDNWIILFVSNFQAKQVRRGYIM